MQSFGPKTALPTFRYDINYLYAGLLSDNRPEVNALAPPIGDLLVEIRDERALFEQAEDKAVVTGAKRGRKDRNVDARVVMLGGVARVVDKDLYGRLFATQAPSDINKLALEKQILENKRLIGELGALPADHPVRVGYEAALSGDLTELQSAITDENNADVELKLARSRMRQFKVKLDTARIMTHGKLQTILGSRKEADSFFRRTTAAPGEKEEEEETEGAPAPAAPGTTTVPGTTAAPGTSTTPKQAPVPAKP
jgi:hypothetical protein